jgi:hypothetical protein
MELILLSGVYINNQSARDNTMLIAAASHSITPKYMPLYTSIPARPKLGMKPLRRRYFRHRGGTAEGIRNKSLLSLTDVVGSHARPLGSKWSGMT